MLIHVYVVSSAGRKKEHGIIGQLIFGSICNDSTASLLHKEETTVIANAVMGFVKEIVVNRGIADVRIDVG